MRDESDFDRLYNIITVLAHPDGDHLENALEDEAHDLIARLRALFAECEAEIARLRRSEELLNHVTDILDDFGQDRRYELFQYSPFRSLIAKLRAHRAERTKEEPR